MNSESVRLIMGAAGNSESGRLILGVADHFVGSCFECSLIVFHDFELC